MISTIGLARLCGTSQGTVDRALHGRADVNEKTRDRILRTAAKHGHRPHPAMREMISGRSMIVQAAFPSISNIFFMDLAARLAEALKAHDLSLQITPVNDGRELLAVLEDSAARRHRLAVFIPPDDKITIPATLSRHLPMVTLLDPVRGDDVPFLSPDEQQTGVDGVNYLYRMGHREMAFLSSHRRAHAIAARVAGYRKRMLALGLRPRVVYSLDPAAWGKSLPTALFCHNDWLAIQAILALRQRGVAVPEQVSVLGVDHSPTLSALFPDLTTLAYPVEALIAAILARLENRTRSLRPARFQLVEGRTVMAR